ncbi:phosphoketolase [Blastomyces gilchristii SLH14081]|uniref:Phosphoketolase n=1 Tax=Blastomyces gilchristii (strain SLH14081) TaxID=559298 RepID=A0A179UG58_BLAGS|nr:phosphoketolase [Blastomyces gilchristii SLH14081]OAT06743.1 phosphoketolase [Blastomyces gilchristii SLH14081]
MDDRELIALFVGYGYQPRIIDDMKHIDADFNAALEWALAEIREIQKAARSGNPIMKPRWPVLILRTPKGWTGPKQIHGQIVEGSFNAHQVPLPAAKKDQEGLKTLNEWLSSYKPQELFTEGGGLTDDINAIIPRNDLKKLGQRSEVYESYKAPKLPNWKKFGIEKGKQESSMKAIAEFIDQVFVDNPHSVRLFSPDELESNKLGGALAHTGRNCQWDQIANAQGYTLTGRVGIFPSYESFLGIIHTMMVQFCKFTNKMGLETSWRRDIASNNYIETSTWTRQEHNGFSHQNPSFISAVLNLKPNAARVYLPPDANTFLSTLNHRLKSKNYINLMVGSKQPTPVFLSPDEAERHCRGGGSVWKFASTDEGRDPDVVLVGIGTELTFEVIRVAALLRERVPELRVRVVNVMDLMILSRETSHPHALSDEAFSALFTRERPIHFNYHGYETEMKGLLFGRPNMERVTIASYMEEGSTTTPFDMMLANRVSRFHVAQAVVRGGAIRVEDVMIRRQELLSEFDHDVNEAREYILQHHKDPDDMYDMPKIFN